MARIRTIKPEFPQSESIGRLSREARLLFILLWTFVDDHGRSRGSSRLLAATLYPYDGDAPDLISGWLAELEAEGCIRQYTADKNSYLDIPNWGKHQRVDNAGKSHIPEFCGSSPRTAENGANISEVLREPPLDLGPRTIGPRIEDLGPRTEEAATPPNAKSLKASKPKPEKKEPTKKTVQTTVDPAWPMGTDQLEYAKRIGLTELEAARTWKDFKGHHQAKGTKFSDWNAAWQNWARRQLGFLGRAPKDESPPKPTDGAKSWDRAQWVSILKIYSYTNNWYDEWGPAPGASGCLVPKELLVDEPPMLDLVKPP